MLTDVEREIALAMCMRGATVGRVELEYGPSLIHNGRKVVFEMTPTVLKISENIACKYPAEFIEISFTTGDAP